MIIMITKCTHCNTSLFNLFILYAKSFFTQLVDSKIHFELNNLGVLA